MKTTKLFILSLVCLSLAFSQDQKDHVKKKYIDSLNRYYQHVSLPVYIYIANSPDETPNKLSSTAIKSRDEIKPFYLDGHGVHIIRHIDSKKKEYINFPVYADGIAPKTSADFLDATRYNWKGVQFYGKELKIELSSSDDMSGVNKTYYSINRKDFEEYLNTLSFNTDGENLFQFYSEDNVGNAEKTNQYKFIVDATPPKSSHQIISLATTNVVSLNASLTLSATDQYSGVNKLYYSIDGENFKVYNGKQIAIKELSEGEHTVKYYAIDNVRNVEPENSYTFFLDKSSPIVASDVLGDKFIVNDQLYFSGRTKFKITAVDNKAGIKKVLYSIDNGSFQEYTEPFYLPSKSGLHTVKYYAVDNLENEGVGNNNQKYGKYDHLSSIIYVDLTGPRLRYQYTGPKFLKGDSAYISGETKISFYGDDPESGLQYISYSLDGLQDETKYTAPFSINKAGTHKIDYFGYDNVNNRNVSQFVFAVDNMPPQIYTNFSIAETSVKDGLSVYPSYVLVFLASSDMETGNAEIYYSINEGKEILYKSPILGFDKENVYKIKVRALDKLGNEIIKEIKFMTDKY